MKRSIRLFVNGIVFLAWSREGRSRSLRERTSRHRHGSWRAHEWGWPASAQRQVHENVEDIASRIPVAVQEQWDRFIVPITRHANLTPLHAPHNGSALRAAVFLGDGRVYVDEMVATAGTHFTRLILSDESDFHVVHLGKPLAQPLLRGWSMAEACGRQVHNRTGQVQSETRISRQTRQTAKVHL